jgi:hypothetical protein
VYTVDAAAVTTGPGTPGTSHVDCATAEDRVAMAWGVVDQPAGADTYVVGVPDVDMQGATAFATLVGPIGPPLNTPAATLRAHALCLDMPPANP